MNGRLLLGLAILLNSQASLLQAQPAIEWQQCLGGTSVEDGRYIVQTSDGGYVMIGTTFSNNGDVTGNHGAGDVWLVKLTNLGTIQWQRSLGGTGGDRGSCIQEVVGGGYLLAGYTFSNDGDVSGHHNPTGADSDVWVVRLDNDGTIVWQRCVGGTGADQAAAVRETPDGGAIVAGESYSNNGDVSGNHGGGDAWLVKLSSTGMIEWQRCYGGSSWDVASDVWPTADGGFVVAGWTKSHNGDVVGVHGLIAEDFWVLKLNGAGQIEWQRCLGGTLDDRASSIQPTSDGGYVVAGYTASEFNDGDVSGIHGGADYWIVKLNASGSLEWQKCLGGSSTDFGYSVDQSSDGGYLVGGWTGSNDGDVTVAMGSWDFWIVRLNQAGIVQWQKSLGGSDWDHAWKAQQTSDGGYIVGGYTGSINGDVSGSNGDWDFWVVKLGPEEVGWAEHVHRRLQLSPNPTSGQVTLTLMHAEELRSITWLDVSGRDVKHIESLEKAVSHVLDIGDLPTGMYQLRVMFQQGAPSMQRVIRN